MKNIEPRFVFFDGVPVKKTTMDFLYREAAEKRITIQEILNPKKQDQVKKRKRKTN